MISYEILLVDDEDIALRGIEHGVDWKRLNIQVVHKAESKQEAISIIKKHNVSIMLSDIEMPGGNGLELIKWVKDNHPDIICVFYTCHADFSFAQEAIRLGVIDYLLKPIPYKELENILQKCIQLIAERKENNKIVTMWKDASFQEEDSQGIIEAIRNYTLEHINVDIKREDLAALVHLNPDYLSKMFKKETGYTITDFILMKKLNLAKQLLKDTDLPIVEISKRVGIDYSSYFVRLFKKKIGVTPQQYRKDTSTE